MLTISNPAERGQRQQGEPQLRRERKQQRCQAKASHRGEHDHTYVLLQLVAAEPDAHQQRADRRRTAQHPQPPGAGVQNILSEDRQQRRRPAEEHGKQIERDHAQDVFSLADKMDAGKQVLEVHRQAGLRRPLVAQPAHQHNREQIEQGGDAVDHFRTGDVQQAAQGWADNHRRLSPDGAGRHRAGEDRRRHQRWQHRGDRRPLQRFCHRD
nr:Uncharacterised protein [Raoultella sp. NCTC 9187]